MTKVYIVDYLGIHCGMHYYLEAFKKVLSEIPEVEIEILSNYSDDEKKEPFFINQYKGKPINKAVSLMRNLYRLRKFVKEKKNDVFIYLTYGNYIDCYFINVMTQSQNLIIDIHEVIAQNADSNKILKSKLKKIYSKKINNVISHSSRTNDFLYQFNYKRKIFQVPHFRYIFPKKFDSSLISLDILQAPQPDKINLLFFGNINHSKGIDILLNSYNSLPYSIVSKVNLIVAGKDFDGVINTIKIRDDKNIFIFKRHINDHELRFLYQNVDYICLPYRKTSQSGILEMAFYFKKPIIATDITYFNKMLTEFPSFGVLAGNTVGDYSKTLEKTVLKHRSKTFFIKEDYDRYTNREEIKLFLEDLEKWMKCQ